MNFFLRILSFARPYAGYAILAGIFNVFTVLFSLVSVTLTIPVLGVLFGTQKKQFEPARFNGSIESIKDTFNYQITLIIEDEGPTRALGVICLLVMAAYLGKNLFQYASLYVMAILRNGTIRDIRNELHRKVLDLPIGYFTEKRKGDIMARVTTDMTEIEWSMFTSLEKVVREPLMILGSIGILVIISPQLTIMVAGVLLVTVLIIGRIGRSLKRNSKWAQDQLGYLLSLIEETVSGLRIIKAFNAEEQKHDQFRTEYPVPVPDEPRALAEGPGESDLRNFWRGSHRSGHLVWRQPDPRWRGPAARSVLRLPHDLFPGHCPGKGIDHHFV